MTCINYNGYLLLTSALVSDSRMPSFSRYLRNSSRLASIGLELLVPDMLRLRMGLAVWDKSRKVEGVTY